MLSLSYSLFDNFVARFNVELAEINTNNLCSFASTGTLGQRYQCTSLNYWEIWRNNYRANASTAKEVLVQKACNAKCVDY